MIPALDFRIFGSGHGFAAPSSNQTFHWLEGEFYTFMHGHGAQLHSVQWTHPRAGERRSICGVEFRPFHSHRRCGRVMVAWATSLPSDLEAANDWLRQFRRHLQAPVGRFTYRPAQGTEAQRAETVEQGSVHDGPVGEADAPNPSISSQGS